MRDSILYSSLRALIVSFCFVIGFSIGLIFFISMVGAMIAGVMSPGTTETHLTTVNTEEILPNAEGKREVLTSESPVILQINIDGVIGMEDLNTKSVRQILVESREGNFKEGRVKGILLFINTPGGTVSDADGIYHAILSYKEKYKVPVYAYVDGLCASGGMYVALAADKVVATDTSLIGSVGVIAPGFLNFVKLMDKVGIEALTISAGKGKDALNPLRVWKPGEEDNFKKIVEYYYEHFVALVTRHRPLITKEQLINQYGAEVFPAPLAKEYGFIDESGLSMADTLKELLAAAHITTEEYQFIQLESKNWWKSLFSSQMQTIFSGKIEHKLSLSPEVELITRNQFLYLYTP